MPPYEELFPVGSEVLIASAEELQTFRREWRLHNPLSVNQLAFANATAVVKSVGFYHGGEALYELDGVPGVWHEGLLRQRAISEVKDTKLRLAGVLPVGRRGTTSRRLPPRAERRAHHSHRGSELGPALPGLHTASQSRRKVRALSTRSSGTPPRPVAKGSDRLVSSLPGSGDSRCRW